MTRGERLGPYETLDAIGAGGMGEVWKAWDTRLDRVVAFPLPTVDTGWRAYDVAPDGQRFLVRARPGQAGQALTVIVNWPALLKKGAGAP